MVKTKHSIQEIHRLCTITPVIPVLVVDDIKHAAPLAAALVAGGLTVLEVTLRTPVALDVIKEMAQVDGCIVGAGTLITEMNVKDALEAGAKFGVSPGATNNLIAACEATKLPFLPASATVSEAMRLAERGYVVQKFFPAEALGGPAALQAISEPLPHVNFCPTGGISIKNAKDYLSLSNTLCVGGSWVAPKVLLKKQAWNQITSLASEAMALKPTKKC